MCSSCLSYPDTCPFFSQPNKRTTPQGQGAACQQQRTTSRTPRGTIRPSKPTHRNAMQCTEHAISNLEYTSFPGARHTVGPTSKAKTHPRRTRGRVKQIEPPPSPTMLYLPNHRFKPLLVLVSQTLLICCVIHGFAESSFINGGHSVEAPTPPLLSGLPLAPAKAKTSS